MWAEQPGLALRFAKPAVHKQGQAWLLTYCESTGNLFRLPRGVSRLYDRRDSIKAREAGREVERALKGGRPRNPM